MRDSDTYQAILDEGREQGREQGRLEQAKKLLLRSGQKSLGAPGDTVTAAVTAITDLQRLEHMHELLGDVKTWQELLALP
jgi:predicted transposase YdaD